MAEIAASVLLKLSINGYDDDTPSKPPWRMNMNSIFKPTFHDPRGPEKYNYTHSLNDQSMFICTAGY